MKEGLWLVLTVKQENYKQLNGRNKQGNERNESLYSMISLVVGLCLHKWNEMSSEFLMSHAEIMYSF